MKTEYYMDVNLTKDVSEWILQQGAEVYPNPAPPTFNRKGEWIAGDPIVIFGGRQIHFYQDGGKEVRQARLFFNDDNKGSALLLLMKWPKCVFNTNLPQEIV